MTATAASTASGVLTDLAERAAARHGDAPAQRFLRDGAWVDRSFAEVDGEVRRVAAGLRGLGVRPGDRVALLCRTRPEWTIADLAICRIGAVCVPVYPTSSTQEIAWVLADSGAVLAIVEDDGHAGQVAGLRDRLPHLRQVLGVATSRVPTLDGLGGAGAGPAVEVDPHSVFTMVYTSGTTGNPKGCQLTHANVDYVVGALGPLADMGPGDVIYAYLPLAHLLTRMVQIYAFETGATIAYSGGDIRQVIDELAQVRPTHLPSVPQLFEKIYDRIQALLATLPDDQRASLPRALEVAGRVRRGEVVDGADRELFDRAEAALFATVRGAFGGQVRQALTGAAPIAPETLEFFFACGVCIYEGYGMTESTALVSANGPGACKIGTVGRPAPGLEVRVADDGEICVRSPGVFGGYWGNEAATAETVVDGWLHTGDLGTVDSDGFLVITGRKKDIIITSAGKNLTPANTENDLRRVPWISDAVMLGDRRPYPVALITLDREAMAPWLAERDLLDAPLAEREDVRAVVAAAVDDVNSRYAPPERIRRFAILDRELTIDAGELTPTLKVRRPVVAEHFADVIEALYAAS